MWETIYDWYLGVSPWPVVPEETRTRTLYCARTSEWPLEVVDGGLAVADVRLAVRFMPPADSKFGDPEGLASLVQAIARAAAARGEGPGALTELVSELGTEHRFEARPYFEMDGQTVEESEWFGATKTWAGYYRLPNGRAVDGVTYLQKTDQFIVRKRVFGVCIADPACAPTPMPSRKGNGTSWCSTRPRPSRMPRPKWRKRPTTGLSQ